VRFLPTRPMRRWATNLLTYGGRYGRRSAGDDGTTLVKAPMGAVESPVLGVGLVEGEAACSDATIERGGG
jgi:hypothetical protein